MQGGGQAGGPPPVSPLYVVWLGNLPTVVPGPAGELLHFDFESFYLLPARANFGCTGGFLAELDVGLPPGADPPLTMGWLNFRSEAEALACASWVASVPLVVGQRTYTPDVRVKMRRQSDAARLRAAVAAQAEEDRRLQLQLAGKQQDLEAEDAAAAGRGPAHAASAMEAAIARHLSDAQQQARQGAAEPGSARGGGGGGGGGVPPWLEGVAGGAQPAGPLPPPAAPLAQPPSAPPAQPPLPAQPPSAPPAQPPLPPQPPAEEGEGSPPPAPPPSPPPSPPLSLPPSPPPSSPPSPPPPLPPPLPSADGGRSSTPDICDMGEAAPMDVDEGALGGPASAQAVEPSPRQQAAQPPGAPKAAPGAAVELPSPRQPGSGGASAQPSPRQPPSAEPSPRQPAAQQPPGGGLRRVKIAAPSSSSSLSQGDAAVAGKGRSKAAAARKPSGSKTPRSSAASPRGPAPSPRSTAASPKGPAPSPRGPAGGHGRDQGGRGVGPGQPASPAAAVGLPEVSQDKRDKARDHLCEKLSLPLPQSEVDLESRAPALQEPEAVAAAVEEALFEAFGHDRKAYLERTRTLGTSLKNNTELRRGVLAGDVAPERLVHMTSQELATKEIQEKDRLVAQKSLKLSILDAPTAAKFSTAAAQEAKAVLHAGGAPERDLLAQAATPSPSASTIPPLLPLAAALQPLPSAGLEPAAGGNEGGAAAAADVQDLQRQIAAAHSQYWGPDGEGVAGGDGGGEGEEGGGGGRAGTPDVADFDFGFYLDEAQPQPQQAQQAEQQQQPDVPVGPAPAPTEQPAELQVADVWAALARVEASMAAGTQQPAGAAAGAPAAQPPSPAAGHHHHHQQQQLAAGVWAGSPPEEGQWQPPSPEAERPQQAQQVECEFEPPSPSPSPERVPQHAQQQQGQAPPAPQPPPQPQQQGQPQRQPSSSPAEPGQLSRQVSAQEGPAPPEVGGSARREGSRRQQAARADGSAGRRREQSPAPNGDRRRQGRSDKGSRQRAAAHEGRRRSRSRSQGRKHQGHGSSDKHHHHHHHSRKRSCSRSRGRAGDQRRSKSPASTKKDHGKGREKRQRRSRSTSRSRGRSSPPRGEDKARRRGRSGSGEHGHGRQNRESPRRRQSTASPSRKERHHRSPERGGAAARSPRRQQAAGGASGRAGRRSSQERPARQPSAPWDLLPARQGTPDVLEEPAGEGLLLADGSTVLPPLRGSAGRGPPDPRSFGLRPPSTGGDRDAVPEPQQPVRVQQAQQQQQAQQALQRQSSRRESSPMSEARKLLAVFSGGPSRSAPLGLWDARSLVHSYAGRTAEDLLQLFLAGQLQEHAEVRRAAEAGTAGAAAEADSPVFSSVPHFLHYLLCREFPTALAVDAGSGGQASGGRAPPDLASNNSRPGPTQLHPGASPLSRGESGAMGESSPRPSGSGGLPGGGQPPLVGQPSTSSGLGAPAAGQQAAALLARASSGSLQQPSSARAGSGPLPEQSPGGWLASIPPFQTVAGPAAHAVNGVAAPGAGGVPLTESSLRELSMALQRLPNVPQQAQQPQRPDQFWHGTLLWRHPAHPGQLAPPDIPLTLVAHHSRPVPGCLGKPPALPRELVVISERSAADAMGLLKNIKCRRGKAHWWLMSAAAGGALVDVAQGQVAYCRMDLGGRALEDQMAGWQAAAESKGWLIGVVPPTQEVCAYLGVRAADLADTPGVLVGYGLPAWWGWLFTDERAQAPDFAIHATGPAFLHHLPKDMRLGPPVPRGEVGEGLLAKLESNSFLVKPFKGQNDVARMQALCDRLRREMSVLICRVPVGPPGAPPVTEAAWQELVLWPAEQAPGRDPYLHAGLVKVTGGERRLQNPWSYTPVL